VGHTINKVLFLFLRRMRAPLLALTAAYAISVLGLVLIPGVDDQGEPWRMDFFHAFYFVTYMATTIGFGEIPHSFSEAQRMWTVFAVYLSVITWLYAIGKTLALIQDPAFRLAVSQHTFDRTIRKLRRPFHIVCGYGDTGALVVRSLLGRNGFAVVIDPDADRINELVLEDYPLHIPGLCADASVAGRLLDAGLLNPYCQGVVALTSDDAVNLRIAIAAKLLNPDRPVICRAESHDTEKNLASFGTDQIINPFDIFGQRLALALHSPVHHLLHEWLGNIPGSPLPMPIDPPSGRWILCGFGRFGKAVHACLTQEGVEVTLVEADPERMECPPACIKGRGTEADTLYAAGIEGASGIVAGTGRDDYNLSIVMTARELNPELFMVGRQNREKNSLLFDAADLPLVMRHDRVIAEAILAHLTSPLLPRFLELSRAQETEWANEIISAITAVVGERVPAIWTQELDADTAPALLAHLEHEPVSLGQLLRANHPVRPRHACIALLLRRTSGAQEILAPDDDTPLQPGDHLLFSGRFASALAISHSLRDPHALRYLLTGEDSPEGWIWRALRAARGAPA
jgi:Trk K+ transport system NAD-binding subunit